MKKNKKDILKTILENQENFLKSHTPEEIHDLFEKGDPIRIKLFKKPVIVKKEE